MNPFRCKGSISKHTHSKRASPTQNELTKGPPGDGHCHQVSGPSSRLGICSNKYIPRTLQRKCTKGQGWTGHIGTLWKTYSAKKCANSVILSTKRGSLQKNRALFLIKNNQRAIYTGVWTSTDGAKSKPGTFDYFFDLWWLTLCQKSPSYFKEEEEAAEQAETIKPQLSDGWHGFFSPLYIHILAMTPGGRNMLLSAFTRG